MDGTILRLPIPELNEERRRELAKVAGQYAEHARVAVRNVRRDGMDQLKKARAAGMAEDDEKLWHDEIQELTDASIRKVDAALTYEARRDHADLTPARADRSCTRVELRCT